MLSSVWSVHSSADLNILYDKEALKHHMAGASSLRLISICMRNQLRWILIPRSTKPSLHKRFGYSLNDARLLPLNVSWQQLHHLDTICQQAAVQRPARWIDWEEKYIKSSTLGFFNKDLKRLEGEEEVRNTGLLRQADVLFSEARKRSGNFFSERHRAATITAK